MAMTGLCTTVITDGKGFPHSNSISIAIKSMLHLLLITFNWGIDF